ncbi:protein kinase [Couchioplanes caeruleus]|uniref:protein kinase domain-containing protein n=1 Tax=Couchioplanes caeruleus TaxID=56438 RepID=UPI00201BC24D|nr:protein kinase [Couchioplanes caeruleus]UQU68232.1 protein kinase [Couchioplanes caeruleus]
MSTRTPLRPADPRRLGAYRLESRLGQGGMGTVYLGRDPGGRPVAIKVVKPEYGGEEEFRARFRSEVNRARQVPPFCTAELLDADPDHETPYLVVEYVDGPSLAEVVAAQGPLTGGHLYSVAVGVATALAAIHGAGVIHRDLKPSNVLFALGAPKVIDFGIARAFEATSRHTRTDQMVGTVAYMAPERFEADSARLTGPAADVFAWGVVVAYAGTGRTPFGGDTAAATAGAILTQPPRLDGLPEPLRDLVAKTLAKDPALRPTAAELLDMLLAAETPDAPATGRPDVRRAAEAVQLSGSRPTGVGSRPWGRTAPALAAAAVVATAAGLLTMTPARDLLFGSSDSGSAGTPAVVASRSSTTAAPSARTSPSHTTRPVRTSAAAPTDVVVPKASPTKSVRACRTSDTSITVTAQNFGPSGTQKGLVSLVNDSDTSCRVDGRVTIRLYNAADEAVTVPTRGVNEPGEAVAMVLRPGSGAFQGIKWVACDKNDSDCPAGNTLRGSLEPSGRGVVAALDDFPAAVDSDITMKSLQLGTLQPSPQGTVAW